LVLTGSDDGRRSILQLVDLAAGCAQTLATERDVIRRATLDASGTIVYEFRVDRRTRADLGVWRRPLDGTGGARLILDPIAADARFGRTFTTELSWSLERDRLAVQSCGAFACRTRLLDPVSGAVTLVDAPDLGEIVGLTGDRLVVYEACRGLPCPILAVTISSKARATLADAAGLAVLADDGAGPRLVHEDWPAGPDHLRVVDPNGTERGRIEMDRGMRLVPPPSRAQAGVGAPAGWLVLAPDGRPSPDRGSNSLLRRVSDGRTVVLEEATR
jgi:hypothetical protein